MKPRSTNRRRSTPPARRGLAMTTWLCLSVALATGLCLGVAMTTGCSDGGSSLMKTHASNTRKADAHKQWNAMRGGVKLQLAESLLRTGQLDEAEKAVAQAIEVAPDSGRAYLLASKVQLEKGELAKARAAIQKSLSLGPRDAEAHYVCGIVAQRYGDWAMAFEHYATAAEIDPRAAEYLLAEAETLIALDKAVEAKELLNARSEDFDGNAAVHLLAARLNQMFGLRGPAAQDCRDALRLGGIDEESEVELGMILAWAGQNQETIGVLRPIVEQAMAAGGGIRPSKGDEATPVTPEVLMTLAQAYEAESQWRDVQWALKPVISRREPAPTAWCLYSRAAVMLGELDSAWEAAQVARRQGEPAAEASLLAAYVAARRGDHESVIRAAQEALRRDPRSAAAYCLLGESYEATGRPDDARRAFAAAAFEQRPELERTLLDSPSAEDGNDGGHDEHGRNDGNGHNDDHRDEKLSQDAKEPRTSVRAASRTGGLETNSSGSDLCDVGNKDDDGNSRSDGGRAEKLLQGAKEPRISVRAVLRADSPGTASDGSDSARNDNGSNDEPAGSNGCDRIGSRRSGDRQSGSVGDDFGGARLGDACQTNRPAWLPIADRMPGGPDFNRGEAGHDRAGSSRIPGASNIQAGLACQPARDFGCLRYQPLWIVQEDGRQSHPIVFEAGCYGAGGADRVPNNANASRIEACDWVQADRPRNEGGFNQNNDDGPRSDDEFYGPPFPPAELPDERAASSVIGLGPVESP